MIKEFNINFTEKEISLIYQKVKDYPWDSIAELEAWSHGTNKGYLKELCNYWIKDFDWGNHEQELNKFSNFTTSVDGEEIHFIREKGSSPAEAKPPLVARPRRDHHPPHTAGLARGRKSTEQ